jgi:hypothetical protein
LYIAEETLALEIDIGRAAGEATKSWDINGEAAQIGLTRVAQGSIAEKGQRS